MNGEKIEIQDLKQQETGNVVEKIISVEFDFLSKGKKIVNDTDQEIQRNFGRQKDMGDSL